MTTFFRIFFLLCFSSQFSCTDSKDFRVGKWRMVEQCFGVPSVCADLVKEETESFWVFGPKGNLRMNDMNCTYSFLAENLKLDCHGWEGQILQIQSWTKEELKLYNQEKVELFRFKREKKDF